jgi:hypothetical protein
MIKNQSLKQYGELLIFLKTAFDTSDDKCLSLRFRNNIISGEEIFDSHAGELAIAAWLAGRSSLNTANRPAWGSTHRPELLYLVDRPGCGAGSLSVIQETLQTLA